MTGLAVSWPSAIGLSGSSASGSVLNVIPFGGYVLDPGQTYALAGYGGRSGEFGTVNVPENWTLAYDQGVGNSEVWLVAVPEPGSLSLMVMAAAIAAVRHRRMT